MWILRILFAVTVLVAFRAGIEYQKQQPLGDLAKRSIAIEYACGPGQNWRMMKFFCGSIPKDERKSK